MAIIDYASWKEFTISSICSARNTGNVVAREIEEDSGETPYVTASNENNGVSTYIDASSFETIKGNCILVGGKTFTLTYQEKDFVSNDSHNFVLRFLDSSLSEKEYLFLITVLRVKFKTAFSWSDAVTSDKLLTKSVLLPAENGSPNWKYINEYIGRVQDYSSKKIKSFKSIIQDIDV